MATIKIRWTVSELENVMTLFDEQKVYRSTAGESGPYSEITGPSTRVALVAGQTDYYYDDTSGDPSYWYTVSYYHSSTLLESDQSDPTPGTGGGNYITLQDLRDFGWTTSQATDAELLRAIDDAEAYLERVTGRWFYPKQMTIRVNGTGSHVLPLQIPIIEISEIKVESVWAELGTIYGDVTLETVRVSNRHLTEGLMTPDDRDSPSLIFEVFEHFLPPSARRVTIWHEGEQNVKITGWFGYTELGAGETAGETEDGSQIPLSRGSAPHLIKRLAMMLVARMLPTPADADAWEDGLRAWQIEKYKARDQEVTYSKQTMLRGGLTGDPEIDNLLADFASPVEVAFV